MSVCTRLVAEILADSATFSDSTTETVLASTELPVETLQVGKRYKIRAAIRFPSTNSTDAFTGQIKVGPTTLSGTVICSTGAVDVANGDGAVLEAEFVVRSYSSTDNDVTCAASGRATCKATSLATVPATFALDKSTAQKIEVTGDWSVAHADNDAICTEFTVTDAVG